MKNLRPLIVILLTVLLSSAVVKNSDCQEKSSFEYVYISVSGKIFSKKLNVEVDFGDEPEQIKKSEEYGKILTGKRSFIAVLNYMVKEGYELIETLDYNYSYQGTGGTIGVGFFMKKKKNSIQSSTTVQQLIVGKRDIRVLQSILKK